MRTLSAIVLLLLLLVLAVPSGLDSCAIAPPGPVFSATHRPPDLSLFTRGRPGVVLPEMHRIYLIGAYRSLAGAPLSGREAAALYPPPAAPSNAPPAVFPLQQWMQARQAAAGPPPPAAYINTYRSRTTAGSFVYYPNCLDGAFTSATRTLQARSQQWGAASDNLKAWIAAQDQVFSNCSGDKPSIPAAPDAAMDPLLAADRNYQIAAAWFYAAEWEKARQSFQQIAADRASPWSGIAPYLIGRTFLREATVDDRAGALDQAAAQFRAVIADPSRQDWHEPSRKLLEYLRLRQDPSSRLNQLGAQLLQPDGASDPAAAEEFIYLYGRTQTSAQTGDLAQWMHAIEGPSPATAQDAAARWRESHNPAWLIAGLAAGGDPASALEPDARQILPGAPAWDSAVYYAIRNQIRAGRKDQARAWADDVLPRDMLRSTRNLLLGMRMQLARDWSEFLRFAPRRPEPGLEDFDGEQVETAKPPAGTAPLFDQDSIAVFNSALPLSLWIDAVSNNLLPAALQLQVAQSAWLRAVILGRDREARALMQRIVRLRPAYASASQPFLTEATPDGSTFAAVLLLLRAPQITPFLSIDETAPDLTKTSGLGGGRWCFADQHTATAEFLTPAQRAEAAGDAASLQRISSSGATYLASQAIAWARSHPTDPRVPEALHLAVQTTRRGCTNRDTTKLSRQAFDILHRQYPKSPWTARTPYWY